MSEVKEAGKYAKIWLFIQDRLSTGFFPCLLHVFYMYFLMIYTGTRLGQGGGGWGLKEGGEMDGRRGSWINWDIDQRFIMQA